MAVSADKDVYQETMKAAKAPGESNDWSYIKKKYRLNARFWVLSYPAKASAFLSNAI